MDELDSEGRVLDLGCGTGWWLAELERSGVAQPRLHGVDLLGERIDAASAALPGADLRVGDARRLPYPDDQFELVTMFTLLSSLPDRDAVAAALSEARRVLAPGGTLLVYEPRIPNPLNRRTLLISRRVLSAGLGEEPEEEALTVLPPLSRRLGRRAERLYPRLARIGLLLTHRLSVHREVTSGSRGVREDRSR